jgi:hypothetical protein
MYRNNMTDDELTEQLRKAASIWFKNDDLLLLEELLRRWKKLQLELSRHPKD